MSKYIATVIWKRGAEKFTDNRYSRAHRWKFDGGIEVPASASPSIVPLPLSTAEAVDPEEAYVASLSSCHMLWFLSIAAKRGFVVDSYEDTPEGVMEKNAAGQLAMTRVTLRPMTAFSGGSIPNEEMLRALHESAHHECFLANSVKTEIRIDPRIAAAAGR